jgi:hypothetical protein
MSQYHCAICGGVFPLGDLTRREVERGRVEYVCCHRGPRSCAARLDAERERRPAEPRVVDFGAFDEGEG